MKKANAKGASQLLTSPQAQASRMAELLKTVTWALRNGPTHPRAKPNTIHNAKRTTKPTDYLREPQTSTPNC